MVEIFTIRSKAIYRSEPLVRDPKYRAFVRSFPCAACKRRYGVEAAHTGPHGISQKASDLTCIPLCAEHHRELHRLGPYGFAAVHGIEVSEITGRLNRIWRTKAA